MEDQVLKVSYKPTRKIKRSFWVSVVVILVLLNGVIIFSLYQAKKTLGDFSSSAKKAAFNSSKFLPWKTSADEELPKNDAPGEDSAVIKRMAGSIRTNFQQTNDGKRRIYEYVINADGKDVLSYYKSAAVQAGYILKSADSQKAVLDKENNQIYVELKNNSNTQTSFKVIEAEL